MEDGFDITQLLELRKLTRVIADHLARELRAHLSTLAPLLNPKNVFGEYVSGGPKIAGQSADKAFAELQSLYKAVHHAKPFNLRSQFDTPVILMAASPEIQPATYTYAAANEGSAKTVTISSPMRWTLSFEGFGTARLSELLGASGDTVGTKLQDCILHQLLLQVTLKNSPGVVRLLQALRFKVTTEHLSEFGDLPLVMISAPLATVRPPDRVIIESTEISGTTQFEEVVDPVTIEALEDPIKTKLTELVARR